MFNAFKGGFLRVPEEVEDSLGPNMEGIFVSRGFLACVELSPGNHRVVSKDTLTVENLKERFKIPSIQGRVVGRCTGKELSKKPLQ